MRVLLVLIAALLAACQPTPQPFADGAPNPLLELADAGGITVRPPDGLAPADSRALAEAIAAALRDAEIPAATQGANSRTRFLTTRIAAAPGGPGGVALALDWSLADAKGGRAANGKLATQADAAAWNAHAPELMKRLAADVAQSVVRSTAAEGGGAPVKPAIERPIYVRPVAGLRGRDEVTLRRSLEYQLRQSKLAVAEQANGDALVVTGNFALSPPANGSQKVELRWAVLRPDGVELGTLSQANAVAAGTFDKPWGELAAVIAQGAAAGVSEILARVPPERLADKPLDKPGG